MVFPEFKRHHMREPGSDGNLNVMFFQKFLEFIRKHDKQVEVFINPCAATYCASVVNFPETAQQ